MPKYRFRILKRGDGRYQPQWKFADEYANWKNIMPGGHTTRTLWGAERQCVRWNRWLVKYEKSRWLRSGVVEEWTV